MLPVASTEEKQRKTTHNEYTAANSNNKNDPQTPPIRPTFPTEGVAKGKKTCSSTNSNTNMSGARRKISPMPVSTTASSDDQDDEEYTRFVQSLAQDDPTFSSTLQSLLVDEDEEDFVLTDIEEDDDDDDDMLGELAAPSSPGTTTNNTLPASPLLLEHPNFYSELEAELGSLLEEDLEAAVSTLLAGSNQNTKKSASPKTVGAVSTPLKNPSGSTSSASPATPLREASKSLHQHSVTPQQVQRLQKLLQSHYQLLVQSAVLSVRAARKEYPEESPLVFHGGETAEDLTEILDGAVGMLQDMDQVRLFVVLLAIVACQLLYSQVHRLTHFLTMNSTAESQRCYSQLYSTLRDDSTSPTFATSTAQGFHQ